MRIQDGESAVFLFDSIRVDKSTVICPILSTSKTLANRQKSEIKNGKNVSVFGSTDTTFERTFLSKELFIEFSRSVCQLVVEAHK